VQHYTGPVKVWVDGAQQFEATVRLTKREVVQDVETWAVPKPYWQE
jgi:hypothetical protein